MYLVSTAPGCCSISEVQHVLSAIHNEVVTGGTELSTLVVVIAMPCTQHLVSEKGGVKKDYAVRHSVKGSLG